MNILHDNPMILPFFIVLSRNRTNVEGVGWNTVAGLNENRGIAAAAVSLD